MRYAIARYQSQQSDLAYRIYVSDCLRMISENASSCGGGPYMAVKFEDIINQKPADNRTGEEIAADIIKRAGIEVV